MNKKKTLILIPCMDTVYTDFMMSLVNLERTPNTFCAFTKSSLIYSARNSLAKQAIDGDFDRILWLDSDMSFDKDLMVRLSERLDEGYDFVSGIYFKRNYPTSPVIYKEIIYKKLPSGGVEPVVVPYEDYPKDSIFPIEAAGFGSVMMTTELLKKIWDTFGLPFSPILGFGEDISFCYRAKQLGLNLYCDSSIKMKHLGLMYFDETTYLSQFEEVEQ